MHIVTSSIVNPYNTVDLFVIHSVQLFELYSLKLAYALWDSLWFSIDLFSFHTQPEAHNK